MKIGILFMAIILLLLPYSSQAKIIVEPCETKRCKQYFSHFKKNAKRGHADSIATLAEFYYHGFGTKKNLLLAKKHYKKAARLGVVRAQYKLGLMYLNIEQFKDLENGVKYLKRAAYNDHHNAPYLLGVIYYSDQFGEQDKLEADKWLAQAYKNKHEDIPEFIEHIFSFEDITQSQFPKLYRAMTKRPMIKTPDNHFVWALKPNDETEVITIRSPDVDALLRSQMMSSRKKIKQLGSRMSGVDCRTSVACRALTQDEMKDHMELSSGPITNSSNN